MGRRRKRRIDEQLALVTDLGDGVDFGERWARRRGHRLIAGVDEAGRGPLAGPVVAAAVVLPPSIERALLAEGLDDSKRVITELREILSNRIRAWAFVGIGVVEPARIDEINVLQASLEAMALAVAELVRSLRKLGVGDELPDILLIDGRDPIPGGMLASALGAGVGPAIDQQPLVRGDGRAVCVAAASVIAKVHRDGLMIGLDARYPGYGFAAHKGYGCAEHLDALRRLGPCPIHRMSFRGVRTGAIDDARQQPLFG